MDDERREHRRELVAEIKAGLAACRAEMEAEGRRPARGGRDCETTHVVARYLGTKPQQVQGLCASGRLKAYRLGPGANAPFQIRFAALAEFIATQEGQP